MHVKYQLNRDKRFVKTVNTKNKLNCMNLQLPIAIFKKSTLSDMHYRKMYMKLAQLKQVIELLATGGYTFGITFHKKLI